MLTVFKKKPAAKGATLKLHIEGMHCPSCSMNIDGSLEDVDGVFESHTSYPKSQTVVSFDPDKVTPADILKTVKECGYEAKA